MIKVVVLQVLNSFFFIFLFEPSGFYFLPQAILTKSSKMADKLFAVRLIPEFTGNKTGQFVVEWIHHVELICELC